MPKRAAPVYTPMAYQQIIDNPGLADTSIAMHWAHKSGRLGRGTTKHSRLSGTVLDAFAQSHGLPVGYYTLESKGLEYFLGKHPNLAPGGADPMSAAARRLDPPASWRLVFTPAAYQLVIDNPGVADARIVVAWTQATGRKTRNAHSLAVLSQGVLDDFARSHGLPPGYYTSERLGRNHFLTNHPELAPGGADRRFAAARRLNPPAGWPPLPFVPVAYQEVIDNPGIVDQPLIAAWAGATGRLARSNISFVSQSVVNDFTDAHGLPRRSFTLNIDGNYSTLQPNPDRLPPRGDPQNAAPGRIPLPERWRPRAPVEAHQNEQVIDPPHNQLPANTNSYSYSVAAQ
ncbi:hypothetical protein ACLQ25_31745, partial [Micromonospora sp. DT44]|uniref:hypothetical protein n=1 Tax=Micromonospora sp. DT44 TaxID=3393439 RepID=UPI003CF0F3EE